MIRSLRIFSLLGLLALTTGCATGAAEAPAGTRHERHTLSPAQVAAMQASVRRLLKDPDSAQFSDLKARKMVMPGGKIAYQVCGFVNAKNSFGGYSGRSQFLGAFPWNEPDNFVVNGMGEGQMTGAVDYACSGLGLS